jgi:hypothetical protein
MLVSLISWGLSCSPAPPAIPPAMPQSASPMGGGFVQMTPMRHFEAYGFYEDKESNTVHGMVCVDMIHLFVLRTNARYANPVARAKAVAQVLEGALLQGNAPHFLLGKDGGDPALYAFPYPGGGPRRVVTITAEDAAGYSLRSGRPVTQEEVARWWLGLLEDLVDVLFLSHSPHRLPNPEGREALSLLAQHLTATAPTGPYTTEQIGQAWQALSPEVRNTIQTLTRKLPASENEGQALSSGEEDGPSLKAE